MQLSVHKLIAIAGFILLVGQTQAQDSLSQSRTNLLVIADGGIGASASLRWNYRSSYRAGAGTHVAEKIELCLFLQWDVYSSAAVWGDMEREVFREQYRRNDYALYCALTWSRWVTVGAGMIAQSTPDMQFYHAGIFGLDTTLRTFKATIPINLFVMVGLTPEIRIGSGFSIPVGAYYYGGYLSSVSARIGIKKDFW